MAFPVVTSQWTTGSAGSSHSFTVPAAAEGDLLLAWVVTGGNVTFSGWSSGWSVLYQENVDALSGSAFLLAKKAGVSEPTTLTVSTSTNTKVNALVMKATGWYGDEASAFSNSVAFAVNEYPVAVAAPDPPLLPPNWGADDTEWLALLMSQGINTAPITVPAGYTTLINYVETTSAGASVVGLSRDLNAVSLDPAPFLVVTPRDAVAVTLAIRPASTESAVTITTVSDETLNDGQTGVTVFGTNFGATQGTGKVFISPTNNVANGSRVEQTVNGWGASSINITAVRGALAQSTNMYLFVVNGSGSSNASGHVVQFNPTRKLKVLVHSSAASATGVRGVVFNPPSGGQLTGTEIGEFTGQTFEASLESGQAVLKVLTSAFGGDNLTTSDAPVVLVRNDTNTTGLINATIIEE